MTRCGECENCKKLEPIKKRVLAVANPPFSHADDHTVVLWNQELRRLPCLGIDEGEQCLFCGRELDGEGDCPKCVAAVSSEEFQEKLEQLVGKMTCEEILATPGVYEIFSEELNNEVLHEIYQERL